jgi:hypothetical protein
VLVGVDFGPASINALACGRAFCKTFGAKLHVLHAMENHFLRPIAHDPKTLEDRAYEQLDRPLTDDDRTAFTLSGPDGARSRARLPAAARRSCETPQDIACNLTRLPLTFDPT